MADFSILQWPLQALISAFCAVLWNQLQETKRKAEKAENDLNAFKIETFSTFMTRSELQSMFDAINKTLEKSYNRIDQRLDKMEERMLEIKRHD